MLQFRTDPAIPLLPPLASGKQDADGMRDALTREGSSGNGLAAGAMGLIDEYMRIEQNALLR